MGFVRFTQGSGSPQFGYRVANRIVACTPPLETGPGGKPTRDGTAGSGRTSYPPSGLSVTAESLDDPSVFDANDVEILVPMDPATIVRLDGCYQHDVTDEGFNPLVEEAGFNGMDYPSLWVAPGSALTPHGRTVRVPARMSDASVVIGSRP